MKWHLFLFAFALSFTVTTHAENELSAEDSQQEFEIRKQYQRQRIEDFYTRWNRLDREAAERSKGADETRAERKRMLQEAERARIEFKKERRDRPPEDPTLWEREVRQRQVDAETNRREYVKKRNELKNLLSREGQIPEEDEFELYLDEESDETSP